MNKKTICSIALGMAVSVLPAVAADETAELRSQLDAVSQRLAELEKTATPKATWTDSIKLKGELRYRYEYKDKDGDTDKSRNRIRARLGAYAGISDELTAGIRIATGSDENPTSTNQDIDDFSSKKSIWLDLAYITYSPQAIDGLSLTAGKMDPPWEQVSDLIFDIDVNPEGINASYDIDIEGVQLMTRLGYFTMNENKTDDVGLIAAQMAASGTIKEDIKITAGIGAYVYNDIEGSAPPAFGGKTASVGNSLDGSTNYVYGYEVVNGFLQADIKKGPAPIKLYAEYLNNLASGVGNDTAWLVGIGTKVKNLSLDYNYRDMEKDSVLGALADSDFGGPGGKGHKLSAKYPVAKNLSVGATYCQITDIKSTDINLFQADVSVKF